jgi:hypothetical protein
MALSSSTNTLYDFSDNNFSILGSNVGPTARNSVGSEISNDFKLFPNPCDNHLQVTLPGLENSLVSIGMMNMSGKMIFQNEVQGSSDKENYDINTSALADGMYIFVIRENNSIIFRTAVFVSH